MWLRTGRSLFHWMLTFSSSLRQNGALKVAAADILHGEPSQMLPSALLTLFMDAGLEPPSPVSQAMSGGAL